MEDWLPLPPFIVDSFEEEEVEFFARVELEDIGPRSLVPFPGDAVPLETVI